MDMCKIRCKIVNSQLTVFKQKKERKSSYMNQYTPQVAQVRNI